MMLLMGIPYYWGLHAARCDWCGARPVAHWYFAARTPPKQPHKACALCGAWGRAQVAERDYQTIRRELEFKARWSHEDLAELQAAGRRAQTAWQEYSDLKPAAKRTGMLA